MVAIVPKLGAFVVFEEFEEFEESELAEKDFANNAFGLATQ
jgi:hypothetical protein